MSETLEHPKYRLNAPYWDNATLWPEGTTIQFVGTPNLEMVPLNEPARDRMTAWLAELDREAAIKAALDGKAFIKRAGDLGEIVEEAMRNRPKVAREVPRANGEIPPRPDMATPAQRRRMQSQSGVVGHEPPPEPKRGGEPPMAILGTTFTTDAQGTSR